MIRTDNRVDDGNVEQQHSLSLSALRRRIHLVLIRLIGLRFKEGDYSLTSTTVSNYCAQL